MRLSLISLSVFSGVFNAAIITVPGDQPTIAAAVAVASNGGTTTSATNCKFRNLRIDYAGTVFPTGGAGTSPEID